MYYAYTYIAGQKNGHPNLGYPFVQKLI